MSHPVSQHRLVLGGKTLSIDVGPERILREGAYQPFLFQTSAGDLLLCGWKSILGKHKNNRFPGIAHWLVSHDRGRNWREFPVPHSDETISPYIGAGIERPDGRYLLFYYYAWRDNDAEGPYTGEVWTSRDGFRTVEGPAPIRVNLPRTVPNFDDNHCFVDIVTLHRSIVAMPDGSLFASAYCRFVGDDAPCTYLPTAKKWRCVLLTSMDAGFTWDYASTIAVDPAVGQEGFDEPVMVRLARGDHAGRLLCLMRTGSAACPVYSTHSDDDGRSWSVARPMANVIGVDPCLLELADGTLVGSWGTRLWDVSGHIEAGAGQTQNFKLMFSIDGGESWSDPLELPLRSPDTGLECNTGYSALAELVPGQILVAYDVGSFNTEQHYLAARILSVDRGRFTI